MARIFAIVSEKEIKENQIEGPALELCRISGCSKLSSGNFYSNDKRVYVTYCEKSNHKFNLAVDKNKKLYIILGGGAKLSNFNITAEYILQAYIKNNLDELLNKIDGFFFIIIIDRKENNVQLIKDRFGLYPIFYTKVKDNLLLSNYASLLSYATNNSKREENKELVARYAVNHYGEIYGEGHTFYKNIFEVKPAVKLTVCSDNIIEERYWELDKESSYFDQGNESEIQLELKNKLFNTIRINLSGLSKTAFMLSGGMDSASLISIYKHVFNEKPPAVSISYRENIRANEINLIEPLAREFASEWNNIIPNRKEFISEIETIYKKYDHPWVTATVYAQERLFRGSADAGYDTLVSGAGGDYHMLGNYPHYLYYFATLKKNGFNDLLDHEISKWITYHSVAPWIKTKNTVKEFFYKCIDFNENGKLKINKQMLVPGVNILSEDYKKYHLYLKPLESYGDYTRSYLVKELYRSASPPAIWSENIMSWLYNIKEISPYWTKELFEYTWKIPHCFKIKDGMNKIMMRNITNNIVPDHIRLRKAKTGFSMPFDIWTHDRVFKEMLHDVLDSKRFKERGVYDLKKIKYILKQHYSKETNHGMQLWQIINLEMWFNEWID